MSKIGLLAITVFLVSCLNIVHKMEDKGNIKVKGIARAYILSGNYGGSTKEEVFPSTYHYSYYHTDQETNERQKILFDQMMHNYLQNVMVNNSVSLAEYLNYVYQNDRAKLDEIHQKYEQVSPKGNSRVDLPTLFFLGDENETVLKVHLSQVQLSYDPTTTALNSFIKDNAKHFTSQIPDDFYRKYYGN